ncbi:TPA: hypothetical protein LA460_000260 [Clostridium botulinum]|nr:hypothetical protein [Clostridium botulinum]HBJ1652864.1 hypothetical protein [Clostridium botulinum]
MEINFNKTDYTILEILIGNECDTPFKSLSTKYLIESSGYSHVKVRQTIKSFQLCGFVKEGSKDGNKKTYYVSNDGVKHYMDVMDYDKNDLEDLIDKYLNNDNKGE